MAKYITLILILFSPLSYADAKLEKAMILIQLQGIDEVWSQKIEAGRDKIVKSAEELLNKHTAQLKLNEEYIKKFEEAANAFWNKVENIVTSEEMVIATSKYYESEFTIEELEQLILFYSSPLGIKQRSVTDAAIPELKKYLYNITEPGIKSATSEFVTELTMLVKQCNCAK